MSEIFCPIEDQKSHDNILTVENVICVKHSMPLRICGRRNLIVLKF